MISRSEALAHILDRLAPLPAVSMPVGDAVGCVVATDVVATGSVPPFANSAMDGVAVRAAESGVDARFRLAGTVAAGDAGDIAVPPGSAVRIMTGAPVPADVDAVVMVEWCRFGTDGTEGTDDEWVEVSQAVPVGNHIRPAGDDIAPGDVVVTSGSPVTPGVAALVRTVGFDRVDVHRRPVVGVMSTGDELVQPPASLGPGQIYDSNRAAIVALVEECGATAIDLGLIADDEALIEAALVDGAARCDALITTGGVSMGDFDFVKSVLARIADMRWMQVSIKPAKPLAFGTIAADGKDVPVFGLPGNPVSSMVSFELFARPGLRRLAGHRTFERPTWPVVAAHDFARRSDGKEHFVRVVVERVEAADAAADGGSAAHWAARSAGGQGSHQMSAMAIANGLAVLPDGDGVRAGEWFDVLVTGPTG